MSRFARRKDDNHAACVAALEKCGCLVMVLEDLDLLVQRAGKLFLLEVKDGTKTPSRRKLTPTQRRLQRQGWMFHVCLSPADCLRAVGLADWRAIATRNGEAAKKAIAADVARLKRIVELEES